VSSHQRNGESAPRRIKYIQNNLGGKWRYDPVKRRWVCADGRCITRVGPPDSPLFMLWNKHGEIEGNVTHLTRPPVTLVERRQRMLERDKQALSLYRRGLTYREVGAKLKRFGPHSAQEDGDPLCAVRVSRIVARALARERAGES
jgi:hypothetical protein